MSEQTIFEASATRYTVEVEDARAHLFRVTLTLEAPRSCEILKLPVWIPGSYMIREFAKNIVSLHAKQGGRKVKLTALDKHRWQTARLKAGEPLVVVAQIYAYDLSVRCAHLDDSHGFFNGTQLFLSVDEREQSPCLVQLCPPEGKDWRVATTLKSAKGVKGAAKEGGFGWYRAESYDELIDHPVEMGTFEVLDFEAAGTPHQMVFTGQARFDRDRLQCDLEMICAEHIKMFGGKAPFDQYKFLTMIVGEGYGGLEHCDSTALICSRNDLPAPGLVAVSERYRNFLGLCSHEYFHAWNIKRIKPAAFVPYRLDQENYTQLLWVFEGFTSYYDDLALVRSGVISQQEYFDILAKTINSVQNTPGRLRQSVAQSSFEAWTKYYRQDENSPNAIVSYYIKGALVALLIDLALRQASAGKKSLDDVMRYLWSEFGHCASAGIGEEQMSQIIINATAVDLSRELEQWTHSTKELPVADFLEPFGLTLTHKKASMLASQGIRTRTEGTVLKVTHVLSDSEMERAGACAGDELVAIDGLRVTASSFESQLVRYGVGERFELTVFRHDALHTLSVLRADLLNECGIKAQEKALKSAQKLRAAWLGEEA